MFFATFASTVALGVVVDDREKGTNKCMGVTELVMSLAIAGCIHSLVAGCPMAVLRPTGESPSNYCCACAPIHCACAPTHARAVYMLTALSLRIAEWMCVRVCVCAWGRKGRKFTLLASSHVEGIALRSQVTHSFRTNKPATCTGPITLFIIKLYGLSKHLDLDFFEWFAWVGLWVGVYMILIAAFDLCAIPPMFVYREGSVNVHTRRSLDTTHTHTHTTHTHTHTHTTLT
jgi:hypothetical protein